MPLLVSPAKRPPRSDLDPCLPSELPTGTEGALATSLAIGLAGVHHLMATFARSMPQSGLPLMLVIIPLRFLSGAFTPREGELEFVHYIQFGAPNTYFVMFMKAALFRGAGFEAAWPQFASPALTGGVLFVISLVHFRKTLG